ncbi:unnamed protein product [Ectocarpus sp. 6 AP-2014]
MACCLICVKDDPVPGSKLDAYYGNPNKFQIRMMEAPCKNFLWCAYGSLCLGCAQFAVRQRALGGRLDDYVCCQGYFPTHCCEPGDCGERRCPCFCLCIESFLCPSCAVSSSRMYLMDKFEVQPDPWDNRIIRFNNFLQLLSCICHCAAIFVQDFRELARLTDVLANLVYLSAVGCMTVRSSPSMRGSLANLGVLVCGRLYDCEITPRCWRWCRWCKRQSPKAPCSCNASRLDRKVFRAQRSQHKLLRSACHAICQVFVKTDDV